MKTKKTHVKNSFLKGVHYLLGVALCLEFCHRFVWQTKESTTVLQEFIPGEYITIGYFLLAGMQNRFYEGKILEFMSPWDAWFSLALALRLLAPLWLAHLVFLGGFLLQAIFLGCDSWTRLKMQEELNHKKVDDDEDSIITEEPVADKMLLRHLREQEAYSRKQKKMAKTWAETETRLLSGVDPQKAKDLAVV